MQEVVMETAYQKFVSQRCIEITSENKEIRALYSDIIKILHEIKRALTQREFELFCEYESQINNIRTKENRCIYVQARKDSKVVF